MPKSYESSLKSYLIKNNIFICKPNLYLNLRGPTHFYELQNILLKGHRFPSTIRYIFQSFSIALCPFPSKVSFTLFYFFFKWKLVWLPRTCKKRKLSIWNNWYNRKIRVCFIFSQPTNLPRQNSSLPSIDLSVVRYCWFGYQLWFSQPAKEVQLRISYLSHSNQSQLFVLVNQSYSNASG